MMIISKKNTTPEQVAPSAAVPPHDKESGKDTSPASVSLGSLSDIVEGAQAQETAEPPNGGVFAWLQVLCSFIIYFNVWGLMNSYGVFQSYYEDHLLSSHTPFQISTIGSLQAFLLMLLGVFTGPVYDIGYFHHLLISGSALLVVGSFLQSFCTKLWQFILVQGCLVGVGGAAMSLLGVAACGRWFTTKLAIVNGIASMGSGVGGIVTPILFRILQPKIGYGWSVRILTLLMAVTQGFTILFMRSHPPNTPKPPIQRRKFIDRTSFTDWPYLFYVLGCLLMLFGWYAPFTYLESFSQDYNLAPADKSFYIVAWLNLASILGRVIPNLLTPAFGAVNMSLLTAFMLAVAAFSFSVVGTLAELLVVTAVYGFWTGAFFSLQPTVFMILTKDKNVVGTRIGYGFAIMAIGLLVGTPIAGALLDSFGYTSGWYWAGGTIVAGCCVLGITRIQVGGWEIVAV